MGDIHLLEGRYNKNGSGHVTAAFHIPNDKTKNNYPGSPTSVVSGIEQAELDKIISGDIYEEVVPVKCNGNKPEAEIEERAQNMWQPKASEVRSRLNKNFKLYGITLARA